MNTFIKQKQTHGHQEQTCGWPSRRAGGGGKDWKLGISRCKLLYKGCIKKKKTGLAI